MKGISHTKRNEKLLNKRLRRKMNGISHTKGNEKLLNERLRRKNGYLIPKVAATPCQEKISNSKGKGYLQKVSKFRNRNPREKD